MTKMTSRRRASKRKRSKVSSERRWQRDFPDCLLRKIAEAYLSGPRALTSRCVCIFWSAAISPETWMHLDAIHRATFRWGCRYNKIVSDGAIGYVLRAVNSCLTREDVDVRGCVLGLSAIINLSCEEDNVKELLDGRVANLITRCLTKTQLMGEACLCGARKLRKKALLAMSALCSGSGGVPLNTQVMARSFAEFNAEKSIGVVTNIMKRHLSDPFVQQECCEALCALSSPPDLIRAFPPPTRACVCKSVLDAFDVYSSWSTPVHSLVFVATVLVGNLAWDMSCRDLMVRLGACEILSNCLARATMKEDRDMPRATLNAITNLCNDSVENAALLGNAGACVVAVRALENASTSQLRDGVFEEGQNAIIALGEAPENRAKLCRLLMRKRGFKKYPVVYRSRLKGLCRIMSEL